MDDKPKRVRQNEVNLDDCDFMAIDIRILEREHVGFYKEFEQDFTIYEEDITYITLLPTNDNYNSSSVHHQIMPEILSYVSHV